MLREGQLARDALHGLVCDAAAIPEHRQLVSPEGVIGEYVEQPILVSGHARQAADERTSSMNASNTGSLSRGPGAPSGWY